MGQRRGRNDTRVDDDTDPFRSKLVVRKLNLMKVHVHVHVQVRR